MANRPPPNQRTESNPQKPDRSIDQAMVHWTRAVAFFTFLLFVTSAIANFFIYKQWQESIAAQKDTREQTRAMVVIDDLDVFPANVFQDHAALIGFVVKFHNIGGTRTASFTSWASIHYFPGGVPNSQDFSKPWNQIASNNSVIGANSAFVLPPVTLSASDVDDVRATLGVAVIWGHAEWSDIFDKKDIHQINFCLNVTPQPAPTGFPGINGLSGFTSVPVKADCNNNT